MGNNAFFILQAATEAALEEQRSAPLLKNIPLLLNAQNLGHRFQLQGLILAA